MNHLIPCDICNNPTEDIDINIIYNDYTFENYYCGVCWGAYLMVTEGLGKSLAMEDNLPIFSAHQIHYENWC
jgi:hypothetical protein|tara:strand:- start:1243 stop:1458 length:216 start_codon:yes stop_codon:yes gene_type:complete